MKPNSVLERHPDLYFEDGDVVLAVKQAPTSDDEPLKHTLFRVHKFLLRHHSATFANFFADANAAPTEVYDGVPLAQMHGDKAEDFALLLSYLYNPSSLVFKRNDPNTPLTVSGVIRLADKYLIEPFHRCLVQQVCEDWPATLNDYDIKQGEIDTLREVAASNVPFKYTPTIGAYPMLSLIPVACDWSKPWRNQPLARWSILDGATLLRCMRGCQTLREYRPAVSQILSEGCANAWEFDDRETPCYRFVVRLFELIFKVGPSPTHGDPLRSLAKCARYWKMPELSAERFPDRLCEDCEGALGTELAEERKRIWAGLPKWFKLG